MILYRHFGFSAIFLALVYSRICLTQLVDQAVETTDPIIPITEAPVVTEVDTEPPSEVICTTCACADNVVDCSNRNITTLFELPDWDGLTNIKPTTVDLSQNLFTTITRISRLPIQVLNFSNCDVSSLEEGSFIYLSELRSLDLSNNMISTSDLSRRVFVGPLGATGPETFKQMQLLNLAGNDIHSLPQDLFVSMPTLTTLDLSGNPLALIDQVTMGAISELLNLRTLRLSSCELETLPAGFLRRTRKLRHLDLSDNRFTTIPAVLKEAPNLNFLSLDKNSIQAINSQNALTNLATLQELNLRRMSRLQNITAGALGGLNSLRILRLSSNPRLTNLDPEFLVSKDEDGIELWPVIKELYLNNNNLSTINSHFLDSWNDLETGDFSNNPYVCDCNNQWMVDVLVPLLTNTPANSTIGNMVCKKPADVRGLTFAQLNQASRTLVCPETESVVDHNSVSKLAIILGIMIGIIVTFPLVLVLVLLWKKGYFKRCRSAQKQEYPDYYEDENERL